MDTTMEYLTCYCLKCKAELARFSNSWDAIGTSYHSPVQAPIAIVGLEATGSAYGAAPDSSIENSSLQDVACIACQTTLGLQCYSAPIGHLLKKEQLILNLSLMSVISDSTRKKANISVAKSIPLTKSSSKRPPVRRRASTTQPIRTNMQSVPPPSRPPVPLFHSNALPTTPVDTRILLPSVKTSYDEPDAENFHSWAKSTIKNQQKDIDRLSGAVDRIERDMQSFRNFIKEVRAELASNRELRKQTQEDIQNLQTQVTETAQRPRSRDGIGLPSKRLDAITEDTLLATQKTKEVNQVKADLKRMKDHLESLSMPPPATPRALASKTGATQQKATAPVSLPKRHHDKVSKLQTPSSDPTSSPNHPSKRTKISHKNVDDGLDDELAIEALGADTVLFSSTKPRPAQQKESSPMFLNSTYRESALENDSGAFGASLPINAGKKSKNSRRRSNIERSVLAQDEETPTSERRQLRNTTTKEANEPPLIKSHKRYSDGAIVTANRSTDGRSLRSNMSHKIPDPEYETMNELYNRPGMNVQSETENMDQGQDTEDFTIVVDAEHPSPPDRVTEARPQAKKITSSDEVEQPSPPAPPKPINQRLQKVKSSVEQFRPSTPASTKLAPTRVFTPVTATPAPDGKPFKCGVCDQRFPSFYALNYHHEHTEGCKDKSNDTTPKRVDLKPFKCGCCKKAYTNTNSLNYHHKHSKACADDTYDELPTCPSCGRSYKVLFNYERHIEFGACNLKSDASEVSAPLLNCNACGDPFKTQAEVERHQCSRAKLHSLNFREASLAARELALVERERIVRQTLEREMMDIKK